MRCFQLQSTMRNASTIIRHEFDCVPQTARTLKVINNNNVVHYRKYIGYVFNSKSMPCNINALCSDILPKYRHWTNNQTTYNPLAMVFQRLIWQEFKPQGVNTRLCLLCNVYMQMFSMYPLASMEGEYNQQRPSTGSGLDYVVHSSEVGSMVCIISVNRLDEANYEKGGWPCSIIRKRK